MKKQRGMGNEGRSIRAFSKVGEGVQSSTGAHTIALASHYGYLRTKESMISFWLCALVFQMPAKLLGHKYFLNCLTFPS